MPTDGYLLRSAQTEEGPATADLLIQAFGRTPGPEDIAAEMLVFEPDRDHVIVRDGQIVANLGAYTRQITVPGAVLPAAHVTSAAVKAEHRRRGLLTRLIKHQFQTMPEPIAVLWASEGRIYQRFGYGMAAENVPLDIDTREVSLLESAPVGTGTVVAAEATVEREQLVKLYDQVRVERPGWSSRDDSWWDRALLDLPSQRTNAGPKRLSMYVTPQGAEGYAFWRVRGNWQDGLPAGETIVLEVVAASPEAYAALWRHLLSIDLTRRATRTFGPVDEPLRFLVSDPRLLRPRVNDGLWLRLVDLPAALAGRRYAAPIDVVFDVTDEMLPANAGRYRVFADAGAPAQCEPTDEPADIACDVSALAAAYLGGVSLLRLADTGRVSQLRGGTLTAASVAFGWHRGPSPSEMF